MANSKTTRFEANRRQSVPALPRQLRQPTAHASERQSKQRGHGKENNSNYDHPAGKEQNMRAQAKAMQKRHPRHHEDRNQPGQSLHRKIGEP
jgi:hypothetical protein